MLFDQVSLTETCPETLLCPSRILIITQASERRYLSLKLSFFMLVILTEIVYGRKLRFTAETEFSTLKPTNYSPT